MPRSYFINRLRPADGQHEAVIGLLREFADSINAEGADDDSEAQGAGGTADGTGHVPHLV